MNKILKALSVSAVAILAATVQISAQTIEEGIKRLDAEQYNAAGKIFKQLVQTAPTAENYFYLGYYYLNLKEADIKPDSARIAFEKGAAIDPKKPDPLCRVGLGAVKLAMKDRGGAKFDFDAVTKDTKSKNMDVLYRIGEAYTLFDETNDPAEAVRNIDLAMVKKTGDPNLLVVKGDAFYIKNEGGDAMTAYETAAAMGKNLAKIKTRMGKIWIQGKNYPRSLQYYREAIEADPNFAPAYRQLGNYYIIFQNYPKAAENYRKYLELADTDDAAKLRYVKLAFTAKDYENATRVLNDIFDRIKDPIKYRLRGFIETENSKPELAVPDITQFLNVATKDRIIGLDYGTRGKAYSTIKEPDAIKKKMNDSLAILDFNKAIELNDTSANYMAEMAKIYSAGKNHRKAAQMYKDMIAKAKKEVMGDYVSWAQALMNDARTTKDTNTYLEAEKIWTKVADFYKEKYPIAYFYSAYCRRSVEGTVPTGKAVPILETYIKMVLPEKDKPTIKKNLADAHNYIALYNLLILKDTAKATEYYKKTLEIDPTNADATDALNKINGVVTPAPTTPPNNGTAPVPTNNGQPVPPKN